MKDIFIDESEEFLDMTKARAGEPYAYFKRAGKHGTLLANFNRPAAALFTGDERQCTVKISRRYVVFLPAAHGKRLSIKDSGVGAVSVAPLSGMVQEGKKFRVYPYKGGAAIALEETVG